MIGQTFFPLSFILRKLFLSPQDDIVEGKNDLSHWTEYGSSLTFREWTAQLANWSSTLSMIGKKVV